MASKFPSLIRRTAAIAAVLSVPMSLHTPAASCQAVSGQVIDVDVSANATTVDYYRPRIAAAPDASYALAWEALEQLQFTTEWQVAVQRYAPNGSPIGPVNYFEPESGCLAFDSWLSDGQQNVELKFDAAGNLLVFMEHFGEYIIGSDGQQSSEITLGVVDPNGAIIDQSNAASCVQWKFVFVDADEQDRPRVVLVPGGLAMVMDGFFGGTNFRNVGLQLYDLSLAEVGEVVVPHDDPNSQSAFHAYPDIATNGSLLVVAWHECPFIDAQGNVNECDAVAQFAQLNGGTLTAVGSNIRANSGDPAGTYSARPAVAMNSQGNSIIVWQDTRSNIGGEVFGQRFDASGQPVGANFQVSSGGAALEFWPGVRPEVAMRSDGSFMVVWSDSTNGLWRSYGRQYDAAGQPVTEQTLLASGAGVEAIMPSVSTDGASYYYTGLTRTNGGPIGVFARAPNGSVAAESPDAIATEISAEVYPNPVGEFATILAHLPQPGSVTIEAVDLLGRIVHRERREVTTAGTAGIQLDTSHWSSGPYFVRLTANGTSVSLLVSK